MSGVEGAQRRKARMAQRGSVTRPRSHSKTMRQSRAPFCECTSVGGGSGMQEGDT